MASSVTVQREIVAGQLASLHLGEKVTAVFDDTYGGHFTVTGRLRAAGSKVLLVGPQLLRTGAGIVASGLRSVAPAGFPPLPYEVQRYQAPGRPTPDALLAAISRWIDESPAYVQASTPLAHSWRVMKLIEEIGEAVGALMGSLGENPRKGVTHSLDDVERELLDVAAAALGALMHFHGNKPTAAVIEALLEHIYTRAVRAIPHGLEMPPSAEPTADSTIERVRAVVDQMVASRDWDGQVSIGFSATLAQELDRIAEETR